MHLISPFLRTLGGKKGRGGQGPGFVVIRINFDNLLVGLYGGFQRSFRALLLPQVLLRVRCACRGEADGGKPQTPTDVSALRSGMGKGGQAKSLPRW